MHLCDCPVSVQRKTGSDEAKKRGVGPGWRDRGRERQKRGRTNIWKSVGPMGWRETKNRKQFVSGWMWGQRPLPVRGWHISAQTLCLRTPSKITVSAEWRRHRGEPLAAFDSMKFMQPCQTSPFFMKLPKKTVGGVHTDECKLKPRREQRR